jgi:hypothetical protein
VPGRKALLAAILVAVGSQAAAVPVRVALSWDSGGPGPSRARIQAIRTVGTTGGSVPVAVEAGPDGAAVLDLGEGVWNIQAEAHGYWSPGSEVAVGRESPGDVALTLWPAASLHGAVRAAPGDPLPRHLDVRLSAVTAGPTAQASPRPGPSRADLRCAIAGARWSCQGPAGLFDVRLEAEGYAPRYAWDVSLAPAAIADLGETVLRRVSSVYGRAVRSDGSSPQGPCHATLGTDVTRGSPEPGSASASEAGTALSAPLSPRGDFQIVGVPVGPHALVVECEAASALRELRVQSNGETRVDPMTLEELALDLVVTPGVDPEGRPWLLTVDAVAPRWRRIVDDAAASTAGRWARRGLTAGSYRVDVKSGDGTPWLQRFFELDAGTGPLSLRVGFLEVAGRVRLGARPVRARLIFSNEGGGESAPASLMSGEDGRFQGVLPVSAGGPATLWTVEVRSREPPILRRIEGVSVRPAAGETAARLELELPIVAVRGRVVSAEGEPRSAALVTLEDARGDARSVATNDEGGFELPDVPPGSYTAMAEAPDGVSERTPLEVVEGVETEVQLVLTPLERFAFHVLSSQGPVANAVVQVWVPPGLPRGLARTDPDGRFETDLPPGTTEVGLTVGAAGHPLKLTRMPVSDEQTITLGASGGTLVLDLERPGRALDLTPYLVHEGAIEAAGSLADWAGVAQPRTGGTAVVRAIEPGVYALCLAGPDETATLWRGALPSSRCRMGSVEPGGTLTLSPP